MTREQRAERMSQLAVLGRFMADPAGRRWLSTFLTFCHVYQTIRASNALGMAFEEGERAAGLYLVSEMEQANPDMYFQMLKEMANERRPGGATGGTDPGFIDPESDTDPDPTG